MYGAVALVLGGWLIAIGARAATPGSALPRARPRRGRRARRAPVRLRLAAHRRSALDPARRRGRLAAADVAALGGSGHSDRRRRGTSTPAIVAGSCAVALVAGAGWLSTARGRGCWSASGPSPSRARSGSTGPGRSRLVPAGEGLLLCAAAPDRRGRVWRHPAGSTAHGPFRVLRTPRVRGTLAGTVALAARVRRGVRILAAFVLSRRRVLHRVGRSDRADPERRRPLVGAGPRERGKRVGERRRNGHRLADAARQRRSALHLAVAGGRALRGDRHLRDRYAPSLVEGDSSISRPPRRAALGLRAAGAIGPCRRSGVVIRGRGSAGRRSGGGDRNRQRRGEPPSPPGPTRGPTAR